MFGYTDENNEKYGTIYVEKGKTSNKIKNRVDNRKAGDPVIFIAPGSGNIPKVPGNITEFCSKGAFVEGYSVLPVVIKYEDNSLSTALAQQCGESFVVVHNSFPTSLRYSASIIVSPLFAPNVLPGAPGVASDFIFLPVSISYSSSISA